MDDMEMSWKLIESSVISVISQALELSVTREMNKYQAAFQTSRRPQVPQLDHLDFNISQVPSNRLNVSIQLTLSNEARAALTQLINRQ